MTNFIGASGVRGPIGIDVGRTQIKAVQLSRLDSRTPRWQVEAAACVPRDSDDLVLDESEAARLLSVLNRQGFSRRHVVLAAPPNAVMTDLFGLPPQDSGAPISQIAEAEFARTQKCKVGTFEMAFWDLPQSASGGTARTVMAAGCSHDEADRLIDVFEACRCRVVAIDVASWAIARACSSRLRQSKHMTAALDLGAHRGLFILFHQGVVVYERVLADVAIAKWRQGLIDQLEIDGDMADHLLADVGVLAGARGEGTRGGDRVGRPVTDDIRDNVWAILSGHLERMTQELRVSLSYASHLYREVEVDQLVLTGGGAAIPGIERCVESAIEIGVQTVAPVDLIDCPPTVNDRCQSPALTMALGLSQYGE